MDKCCDIYLFCLWHRSKMFWKFIVDQLSKNYKISFLLKSCFPNSLSTLRRFYNREQLVGGYEKKLIDVKDDFLFCICKDEDRNNLNKLYNLKKKFRALSGIKNDYNFIHSSNSIEEFARQLNILEKLPWQQVTYT